MKVAENMLINEPGCDLIKFLFRNTEKEIAYIITDSNIFLLIFFPNHLSTLKNILSSGTLKTGSGTDFIMMRKGYSVQ